MVDVPKTTYPGVYVEELPWGVRSITGVETSTAAFVGRARVGPTQAVRVRSFSDFQRVFGPPDPEFELGHGVRAFFENGGGRAWVVRVPEPEPLTDGLRALEPIKIRGVLCLPGEYHVETVRHTLEFSSRRGLFLVADAMDLDAKAVAESARALAGVAGAANAALYWPPLRATDGSERLLAPSGAVCGLLARVDRARGVWKAPAGVPASLLGPEEPAVEVSEDGAAALADAGVNAIRALPGRGIRVWGARTLSSDTEWKYVNVRRLFLFLEHSIDRGTQWAVFEPNDEPLWAKVRVAVGAFLTGLFRQGAFAAQTIDDAYFVRCDRTTMTQADLELGNLNIQVGFAPLKPAEFVVIRIGQRLGAVATEIVGDSTGEPGLELRLPHAWVDPASVVVIVEHDGGWRAWSSVEDLGDSGPSDAFVVMEVDEDGAVLRFGDGEHGAIPAKGARVQASYRYGVGEGGNIRT
jgi:phage tail sheath protein FI